MENRDKEVQAVLRSWAEHTVPPPPAPDQSLRVMAADGCMALRRLIELVAANRDALQGPEPTRRRPVPPRIPAGAEGRDLKLVSDNTAGESALTGGEGVSAGELALDDDVQGGTQGWMRRLVPNLVPGMTERVYLADQTCALRRVLELLVPMGATVDGEGRLVLPGPLAPTGTGHE